MVLTAAAAVLHRRAGWVLRTRGGRDDVHGRVLRVVQLVVAAVHDIEDVALARSRHDDLGNSGRKERRERLARQIVAGAL